jgi:glycosyltransferase involved in cell wall biosynthesis
MRIIHILKGKANPETLNGVNKAVHWMATYQTRLGHDVEVWGLSASMTLPPHLREYSLRIFPVTRLRWTLGKEIKAALACLDSGAWVHFHSVYILEYPAIARVLKIREINYSITPHNGYAAGVFKKSPLKKHLYVALREAKFLRNAAWIHAIGKSEIFDILRIAPHARVVLFPNGQMPLVERPAAAPPQAERPLIGFCGRLDMHVKGLDYLLEGFAAYKAKGGKGELWMIGDGKDRALLERKAAEGSAQSQVRFLGAKYGEEKLDFLAGFDVFIHCSRWEGLPTACLEAASLRRPLLVSRETNLAEYVEQSGAGLVLDETSAAGIERALKRVQQLYENNHLRPMGENARQLIENEFQWEKNARSFIAAIAASGHAV